VPTLCTPPVRIGELNAMSDDLCTSARSRRYMLQLDVQHCRAAGDVGAAGVEQAGLRSA